MPDFFVNAPNYQAPSWSWIGNLPSDFYQGAQQKQQYDQSHAFQKGLPTDAQGNVDWGSVAQTLAKTGDTRDLPQLGKLIQQSQSIPNDPILSRLGQSAGPGGTPKATLQTGASATTQGGGAVASPLMSNPPASAAAARPTTPQLPVTTDGDSGGGATVGALVSSALPQAGPSGAVARNMAAALKVSPDAPLTPDQLATARKYLNGYLQRTGQGEQLPGSGLLARGLRNDNPGNIEDGKFAQSQPGYAGSDGRFAKYATPEAGMAAASTLIGNYGKAGFNTVSKIVQKWAPSADGNNTQGYASFVAKQLGVDPNQPLDTSNPQVRQQVASAMAQFENGGRGGVSQQGSQSAGAAPSPYQELWPQGAKNAQQAVGMIDADIDSYSKYAGNPRAEAHVRVLEDIRNKIASAITPSKFGPIGKDQYEQPIYGWINSQTQTVTPVAPLTHESGPLGVSNVHGDDYLHGLDPNVANQVKALADGRLAFPSGYALKSPYWQKMLQYVSQYDPSFDAIQYNARSRARTDATSGKLAQNNNALNTGIGHVGQLADAVAGLGNVSWSQTVNRVKNAASAEFGGTGVTNFDAIKNRVAPEIVKIWRGTGGAESDIKRDIDSLSDAKTPAQLYGALHEIAGLMRSKIEANQAQYVQAMGPSGAHLEMITPQSKAILNKIDQLASGGAVTASGTNSTRSSLPKISTDADYAALPSGATFIDPNGKTRRKP